MLTCLCTPRWAITNPHLSLHIPSTARLAAPSSTQRKRNGQPRRTRPTVSSVVSNLHLLLRVPSFARWPLGLRFFDKEFYNAWQRWNDAVSDKVRGSLPVVTDFGPDEAAGSAGIGVGKGREGAVVKTKAGGKSAFTGKGRRVGTDAASSARDPDEAEDGVEEDEEDEGESRSWGIHAIPLDYAPMRDYVAKAQEIFAFERQGSCVSCGERLVAQSSDQAAGHDDPPPLLAVCPNAGCEAVGHLTCWGGELLDGERRAAARPFAQGGPPEASHQHVVPIEGRCPGCGGPVRWVDMMKELTLRQRGAKEVVKLLKKKRAATARVGA